MIPSPARREHPDLANAWVLKEMKTNEAQREQAAGEGRPERMSLSGELCLGTVQAIVDKLGLEEQPGGSTPERMVLHSPMVPDAPVGCMRLWRRAGVADLVYVALTVPMIELDSHMLFAFTPPESPVPHFTLDSIAGAPGEDGDPTFVFHLDLIPKADLGAHLGYLRHCFEPLSPIREEAGATPGLTAATCRPPSTP